IRPSSDAKNPVPLLLFPFGSFASIETIAFTGSAAVPLTGTANAVMKTRVLIVLICLAPPSVAVPSCGPTQVAPYMLHQGSRCRHVVWHRCSPQGLRETLSGISGLLERYGPFPYSRLSWPVKEVGAR